MTSNIEQCGVLMVVVVTRLAFLVHEDDVDKATCFLNYEPANFLPGLSTQQQAQLFDPNKPPPIHVGYFLVLSLVQVCMEGL